MRAAPEGSGVDFDDEEEGEDDEEGDEPPMRWAIEPTILNASGETSITEPGWFSSALYR